MTILTRYNLRSPFAFHDMSPTLVYIIVVGATYAGIASFTFLGPLSISAPNRDMWQHLAVLHALIEDPLNPHNPFVNSTESSRSFGPFWVAMSFVARAFGLTPIQALAWGAVVNLGLLAIGIYSFARACLPTRWGPVALFAAMSIGWSAPLLHTGFHSIVTLIEGAAYPAVTMIAGALLSWSLTLHLMHGARVSPLKWTALSAFIALMIANHQLGAAIALVGVGFFAVLSPGASLIARTAVIVAMLAGLGLAALWPYHDPFAVLSEISNARWSATANIYDPFVLLAMAFPAGFGVWGLFQIRRTTAGLPLLATLVVFAVVFAAGILPTVPVGHRFAMPLVLVLHIGFAVVLLSVAGVPEAPPLRKHVRWFVIRILAFTAALHVVSSGRLIAHEMGMRAVSGDLPDAVAQLLPEPLNDNGFAGEGVAAWPIVASGRRILSVPWPEPLIQDLVIRQEAAAALFDVNKTLTARVAIAEHWNVHALIIDSRHVRPDVVQSLQRNRLRARCAGPLMRFDLKPPTVEPNDDQGTDKACRLANFYLTHPLSEF